MNRSQPGGDLPEPVRRYFQEVAAMEPPSDLLDAAVSEIERTPRPNRLVPALGVAAAAAVVIAVVIGTMVLPVSPIGVDPSVSPGTAAPSPSGNAEPTHEPEPSASMLPGLGLPGTRLDEPAGEYGWSGALGAIGGMHKVIVTGLEYRQTQLTFAVADDCFAHGTDTEPVPVTVAGFDGLYVEPYEDPTVLFTPRGIETTGAYALAIGDRTLCVYLSWDPNTTHDELESARQVVESIRGQPFGTNGIRINFTLPAGWDTG